MRFDRQASVHSIRTRTYLHQNEALFVVLGVKKHKRRSVPCIGATNDIVGVAKYTPVTIPAATVSNATKMAIQFSERLGMLVLSLVGIRAGWFSGRFVIDAVRRSLLLHDNS